MLSVYSRRSISRIALAASILRGVTIFLLPAAQGVRAAELVERELTQPDVNLSPHPVSDCSQITEFDIS